MRAGDSATGVAAAVARFLSLLPALVLGDLCLRAWALFAAMRGMDSHAAGAALVLWALAADLLVLLRGLPVLFLLSWPLLTRPGRARTIGLVLLWSLWLYLQVALEQYYLSARVPLGSDLFGYSWEEIHTTVAGGVRTDALALAGMVLPLLALWLGLAWRLRAPARPAIRAAVSLLLIGFALWWLPLPTPTLAGEDARQAAGSKLAYFVGDSLRYARGTPALDVAAVPAAPSTDSASAPADPRYPFVHDERTADTLGPYFNVRSGQPPHLVFIIVEGLGRSFSGPQAARGSFTPFLDELAERSLYWNNFLSAQGRTFAVLPSVFGSLPFAEQGFAALGPRMPAHAGVLNVLKRQGYGLQFYAGTDADFDNERAFLQLEGVDRIVDEDDFGAGYTRNPYSSWGYDDAELVKRVLADASPQTPTVRVIQTMSMHSSYRFPELPAYRRRFEQRLDELHVAEVDKPAYREFGDIYASVLFTDAALRRYFEAMARSPEYANTIFVITGDHRLPELPMDTKIERYHVPLIVYSPLLKHPQRFRAISSHLDLAPSLLAFLSHNYGLQRPQQVAWVGTGLDTSTAFRGEQDIPLKHAKTLLADYVSGTWFLSHDQLYSLGDGLRPTPVDDPVTRERVRQRLARYQQDNAQFAQSLVLSPEGASPALVAYTDPPAAATGSANVFAAVLPPGISVRQVDAPAAVEAAATRIEAVFANGSDVPSEPFVPLLVLSDASGREVRESYAPLLRLAANAQRAATFSVDTHDLAEGSYYFAVIPSHPDSGRSIGRGSYRVPLAVHCCGPGAGARAQP